MKQFGAVGSLVLLAFALNALPPAAAAPLAYSRVLTATTETGLIPTSPIRASDNQLYGIMSFGGSTTGVPFSSGTIYRTAVDGTGFTVLHRFAVTLPASNPSPPSRPVGQLVEASDGRLYGVSDAGGNLTPGPGGQDAGTIFRLNKDGTGFEPAFLFEGASGSASTSTTGQRPIAGLLRASDNRLYGHTFAGGTSNRGVLYRLTLQSGSTLPIANVVVDFGAQTLREPAERPVEGPDGMIYGITIRGGTNNLGALYRVATDGTGFEILHSFTSAEGPPAALLLASSSRLVGSTTAFGDGPSIMFAYDFAADGPAGYSVLSTFTSGGGTGAVLLTDVTSDGKIQGSQFDVDFFDVVNGRIIRVNADGTGLEVLTTLASNDGTILSGPLLELGPDSFFGATANGGEGNGTLFRISSGSPNSPVIGQLPSRLKADGAKRIRTAKAKVRIKGRATGGSDFDVEFRVGTKGKFKPAKGTAKWSLVAKLKPGKNSLFVRARLTDGTTSRPIKITVIRE